MAFYARVGVNEPFDLPNDLVTSPFFSSSTLAGIRLLLAVYALVTSIVVLAIDSVDDIPGYFSYFTHLTYIGLVAYFFASGTQTLAFAIRRREGYPLQRWPRFLQFLHSLLLTTVITFPILVTIVFWALLASSETFASVFSSWSNISMHALNTVFAFFEILFTNIQPPPWLHLPFCIILLGCYLGVAYITHATEGFYVYSFLDPSKQHALLAGYIVGIAVAECIIFAIIWGICRLRRKFFPSKEAGHGSARAEPESLEEWEEVGRTSMAEV